MTNMGKGETMAGLDDFAWKKLCSCWERWHRGESREPMFNIAVTPPAGSVKCPHHYLSMYDFSIPAAEIFDEIEAYAAQCAYPGGAYPSVWLNFGPGVLAAMVGGEGHNGMDTVWFTPGKWSGMTPDRIHPRLDRSSPWFRRVEEFLLAARERNGRLHIGCTDLGGTLDVVNSLVPGEELLYALYDSPEEIRRLSGEIHEAWFETFNYFGGIIPENHGFSTWDGTLSALPYYMLQCDFCYMISPEMFGEFVLPELRQSCKRLGRSFYHLDGKGELPHLPQLLEIEELGGVQWVPGAGGGTPLEWLDVYRAIAAANKKMWISLDGDFDGIARLIEAVGRPELFVIRGSVPAERETELRDFIDYFRR